MSLDGSQMKFPANSVVCCTTVLSLGSQLALRVDMGYEKWSNLYRAEIVDRLVSQYGKNVQAADERL